MLDYDKISHDLSLIKLQGSGLPMEQLVDEYRKYHQEAYDHPVRLYNKHRFPANKKRAFALLCYSLIKSMYFMSMQKVSEPFTMRDDVYSGSDISP